MTSLIELVGPAGVGKTTVLRALARRDPRIRRDLAVRQLAHIAQVAPRALALLPLTLELAARAPRFLWDNARHVGRLAGLDAILTTDRLHDAVVVFEEGPLFLLTRLLLAAERQSVGGGFHRHWHAAVARWAGRFDLVVRLDAPDAVLTQRIRERRKQHRVKNAGADAVARFLAEYRQGYNRVLAAIAPANRGRMLVIDTAATTLDGTVEAILDALRSPYAAQPA